MSVITTNKRAYFDYEILEIYEAGVELKGHEVKSVKTGHVNIAGSYVIIRNNEAWLINADIPAYQPKNMVEPYDSKRTRRLLLKSAEIKNLIGLTQQKGLTLVPLRVYTKNASKIKNQGRIKIEIGLAKSRKKADKREAIQKRETKKELRMGM